MHILPITWHIGVALSSLYLSPIAGPDAPVAQPIKVFILARQSNMEGAGRFTSTLLENGGPGSLEHLVKNPTTSKQFGALVDSAGKWRTRDDVWISYGDRKGLVSVGYGSSSETIGLELGFGWLNGDTIDEPVLLIKGASGGKRLAVDFRSRSAGESPYSLGATTDVAVTAAPSMIRTYCREVLAQTKAPLSNLGVLGICGNRTMLAGVGWYQRWNGRLNDLFNNESESNMRHFMHDLRRDLGVRKLPSVIAETGLNGATETHPQVLSQGRASGSCA